MKCLTVLQPYADGLMGPKRVENRTWRTNHRGPLLIHAGKSRAALDELEESQLETWPDYDPTRLVFGAILGMVDLTDCVPWGEYPNRHTNPWATGPRCWVTLRPRRLVEPIPYLGALGLYDVPDELLKDAEWL